MHKAKEALCSGPSSLNTFILGRHQRVLCVMNLQAMLSLLTDRAFAELRRPHVAVSLQLSPPTPPPLPPHPADMIYLKLESVCCVCYEPSVNVVILTDWACAGLRKP